MRQRHGAVRKKLDKKLRKAKRKLAEISIREQKIIISYDLEDYKDAAKDLRSAVSECGAASKAFGKRASHKNEKRYNDALSNRLACAVKYKGIEESINAGIKKMRAAVSEIEAGASRKQTGKATRRFENFHTKVLDKMTKIEDRVNSVVNVDNLLRKKSEGGSVVADK